VTHELSQLALGALLADRPPVLVLPVGLPGSGKSTLANSITAALSWPKEAVISTDALRTVVGGRRDWLHDEELVFNIAQHLAEARLRNARPVYLDATNVHSGRRKALLEVAGRLGRPALLIKMEADPTACRERRAPEVVYDETVWLELLASFQAIDWRNLPTSWARESTVRGVLDQMRT
jgi:predicted kinase